MTDTETARAEIQAFGRHFHYDVSYLEHLLQESGGAFEVFTAAQPMSTYRQALPQDAHFVARVAAMQGEDCGPCTQLNLRMAIEAGVDREMLRAMLEDPKHLPQALADVYAHAAAVSGQQPVDEARAARIRQGYGDEAFAELAVLIAGCRIYPTVKRALLMAGSCEILTVDV